MTNDNDLIRRGDALAACQIHNSARSAEITIAALPGAAPAVTVKPTEAQIASACLSYDHSFGLMDGPERLKLMHQAREWLHAWQKEITLTPASPEECK